MLFWLFSDSADRFCYEKLNSEGNEKGNCGPDSSGQGWVPCNKQWVNSMASFWWTHAQDFNVNLDHGGCCCSRTFFFFFYSIRDVLCGLLLCTNLTEKPRFGELQGKLTSLTIHHQNRYMDCRWENHKHRRRRTFLFVFLQDLDEGVCLNDEE